MYVSLPDLKLSQKDVAQACQNFTHEVICQSKKEYSIANL
jgi:hypothetical protein